MKFHRFDPYTPEAERRAKARAEGVKERSAQLKSAAFAHQDPDIKRRREVRTNQTVRAKVPVTLPKVW